MAHQADGATAGVTQAAAGWLAGGGGAAVGGVTAPGLWVPALSSPLLSHIPLELLLDGGPHSWGFMALLGWVLWLCTQGEWGVEKCGPRHLSRPGRCLALPRHLRCAVPPGSNLHAPPPLRSALARAACRAPHRPRPGCGASAAPPRGRGRRRRPLAARGAAHVLLRLHIRAAVAGALGTGPGVQGGCWTLPLAPPAADGMEALAARGVSCAPPLGCSRGIPPLSGRNSLFHFRFFPSNQQLRAARLPVGCRPAVLGRRLLLLRRALPALHPQLPLGCLRLAAGKGGLPAVRLAGVPGCLVTVGAPAAIAGVLMAFPLDCTRHVADMCSSHARVHPRRP